MAIRLLMVKYYDKKMIKLPKQSFYKVYFMQLTNKKIKFGSILVLFIHFIFYKN